MVANNHISIEPSHSIGPRETARSLKIVHFSTEGAQGGAGRAAYNIHRSLLGTGCDSWMVVANNSKPESRILNGYGGSVRGRIRNSIIQRAQTRLLSEINPRSTFFPDRYATIDLAKLALPMIPEIIHLHWVSRFLTSRQIRGLWERYRTPIVWTAMDLAPLTGGCHYSYGCTGFEKQCGECRVIRSSGRDDASRSSLESKRRWLRDVPITFVGATEWVIDRVYRSSLFSRARAVKIPYGIDQTIFFPVERASARRLLNLPIDRKIIFFGATDHNDERKGMSYLVEALAHLHERVPSSDRPLVLIAGQSKSELMERIRFDRLELGYLSDERVLACAYQAADLFVCPSVEDAGPLMIPESLMCGTPVVAFAECGGAPDYIRSGINGYLAESRSASDMARGIQQVMEQSDTGLITQESCREGAARECAMETQASRYRALYEELTDQNA